MIPRPPARVRAAHERLADRFVFERRGPVEIKGKGVIETWFLVERNPPRQRRGGTLARKETRPIENGS